MLSDDEIAKAAAEGYDAWRKSGRSSSAMSEIMNQFIATAAYRKGLEAAASVCDDAWEEASGDYNKTYNPYHDGRADAAELCEKKIRARLKELEGREGEPR